jgi:GNAT superfamily N-acetyltransferase
MMPEPRPTLEIRNFTREHIPGALELCGQVGWNHLAADWQRCIDLNPEGCIGGFLDGRLVATSTVNRFSDFGWIGTFLVDESLRGKGCGKQMFEAVIAYGANHGLTWLGLDSTEAGRPIYLKYGCTLTDDGNEMWGGPNGGLGDPDAGPLTESHWAGLLALDRERTAINRSAQLRHLLGEEGASVRSIERGGRLVAFGFSRPGKLAGAIGPVVAESDADALKIIAALRADRRALDGDRGVALAILDRDSLKQSLAQEGFQMRRRLLRMYHPEKRSQTLNGTGVFVSTGLGMG